MNKKLQIMCLTAFALIGLSGSGNCISLNDCAKNCFAEHEIQKCEMHHSTGKEYSTCAVHFCDCWEKCRKSATK